MPQVAQRIPNLLGGVSQQDERIRRDNQATEQINGLSDPAAGLRKRPPSEYVSLLEADPTPYEDANGDPSAFIHTINRDLDDKYRVIVRNGDLKVFHATTGAEISVSFPDGKAYLSGVRFRAVTVEDITYLVNQDEVVAYGTDAAAVRVPEALIYVRLGNEDTHYEVHVGPYLGRWRTSKKVTEGDSPVDTLDIAEALKNDLIAEDGFSDNFEIELFGSAIYVYRTDGADFTVTTKDGLSDQGLLAIKDSVQSFDQLPVLAPANFKVQVTGEPGTEFDNYWLTYVAPDAVDGEEGIWKEAAAPGALTQFNKVTMPHQLVLRGAVSDQLINEGSPPLPEVTAGKLTEATDNWDELYVPSGPSTTVLADGDQAILEEHDQYVKWDFPAAALGLLTEVEIDLEAFTFADLVETVALTLERYDSSDVYQETLVTQVYDSAEFVGNISLQASTTPDVANWNYLKLILTYQSGATPAAEADRVFAKLGFLPDRPPITIGYSASKDIDFGPDQLYPMGYDITVNLESTDDFTYAPTIDEDGPTVASALQALIDAHGSYTATVSGGVITVETDGVTAPVVLVTFEFDEDLDTWFPDADLSGATLTDSILKNLTDTSEALVVSWAATTIHTSGLSGGTHNTFARDDLVEAAESGTYFVFKTVTWEDRDAGDNTTNPFPNFVRKTLTDITFYQGRLGFLYADRLFFSAAGKLTKLFRHSARLLRDDDPIGAQSALPMVASFDAAITWNKSLYLRAENAVVLVTGEPVLTPRSIRLDLAAEVESSSDCYPTVVGQNLFLARPKTHGVQIMELRQVESDVLRHTDITLHCTTYIPGRPKTIVGSGSLGMAVVLPQDCSTNYLFVYSFVDNDRDRVMASWSRWELPTNAAILQIDLIDGTLGMVIKYPDGIFLETIDLDEAL